MGQLRDISELQRSQPGLHDRWIAIDPRGGRGLVALRSGAVVVDYDRELGQLCRRLADAHKTSLTILYCGATSRA